MKRMIIGRKRYKVVAAAAASVLLLAGCAPSEESNQGPETPSESTGGFAAAKEHADYLASNPPLEIESLPKPAEPGVTLAVVNCTLPSCLPNGAAEPGKLLGWNVLEFPYDYGKGPSDVVSALTAAIGADPDVIAISQGFGDALVQEQVDAAVESGIKFINIGSSEDSPGYSACIQCTPSMEANGLDLANVMLADAGAPTSVGIVTDKNYSALVSMAEGVQNTIEENGEGTTSELVELNLSDNPAANASRLVSFLQRNPDVEYLVYTTPSLLPGASSALAAANIEVKTIAPNPTSDGELELLMSGDVDIWTAAESGEGAWMWRVVDAAARALQGAPIEPKMPVGIPRVITAEESGSFVDGSDQLQGCIQDRLGPELTLTSM